MKKLIFGLLMAAAATGFADLTVKITFETKGPDSYKSGAPVKDGECYALVWVRSGTTFKGFLADGNVVDPVNSRTLTTEARAKDAHCDTFAYQASKKFIDGLGNGGYVVCLLDTRGPDGELLGKFAADVNGVLVPVAVNGYQVVADASTATEIISDTTTSLSTVRLGAPVQIANTADFPVDESELKPVVKSAKVINGKFVVTIEKAVPYLNYDLKKGSTPGQLDKPNAADEARPGLTETLVLETSAADPNGFMAVTAERNQQ